jgi:hypothetical protein
LLDLVVPLLAIFAVAGLAIAVKPGLIIEDPPKK